MTDFWTDKKRGFVGVPGNLSPNTQSLSFQRFMRQELGGLNQTQVKRFTPDGEMTIKSFGNYEKVISEPVKKEEKEYMPITIYQPPSEIEYRDLAPKTRRYWGVPPTYDLSEVANSRAVCLPAPTRILTDKEVIVFRRMATNRKVFIFPGSDYTIFNSVLEQLESIFEAIPFTNTGALGSMTGILPNGTLIHLPVINRNWLKVRNSHSSLATVRDYFGKGLGFQNIITLMPGFVYNGPSIGQPWSTDEVWGSQVRGIADIGYDTGYWTWARNSLYPASYSLDDWSSLTKSQFINWLDSVEDYWPLILKLQTVEMGSGNPHTRTRNEDGWYDFQDVEYYDFISATLTYYTGDNILVASFTPGWLTSLYDTILDPYYTVKEFSNWWAYQEWGTTDRFNQLFFNMMPYLYGYDGYIPPIQQ